MEFLTVKDLSLNPAGYLISTTSKKPVTHPAFVAQQKNAEYTVKLADAIKGKTFKCGKTDDLDKIKAEVLAAINAKNIKQFIATPEKPKSAVKDELVQHALNFANYEVKKGEVAKINEIMAEFEAITAVEEVGDYFSEGLVKLTKIYTTEEILAAVQATAETLK